jgi:hypothetical protein
MHHRRKLTPSELAIYCVVIALIGSLCACGGKPMAFPPPESEMGDRPGLFTGENGAWTVYQK